MIYLKEGNTPLNEAWADEIYQEGNSTYQLTFKYPLNNDKWKLLTEETKLISDDLDGEQEFTIFEVVKEQGYITVYANQVMTLLNYYSISSINVDRVAGNVVMTALAGAILRDCPFSFYSDITDKHTFNAANISVMDALIKEKHSIVGQWGGDLVRDKYQVSLLKNGGSETEALFMYKKNMRSTQQTTSTKELRTRIHFRKKIEVGEGDSKKEQWLRVTVDSPLINKYKHIYEGDMEVTDEDVKDLASLTKYGEQYYRTTLCDMIEDSLELDVAGVGDVPVKIFDVVSVYHEQFGIDVRKKITKYRYSPMGKRLKSVGFGTIQQTLGGALNAMVSESVKAETAIIEQDFEVKLEKELKNADKVFDQKMNQMEQSLSDEIEQAKAKAEEVKAAMTDHLTLKINQSKSEVTDRLQKEFNQKLSSASADLAGVRANLTQAQSRLSGDISQIQSDIAAIRGKQSQSDSELAKQVQSINQAKSELAGVKTNLTQAQSQLSGSISQIRSDVGSIRTKQGQQETEIGKQVQALNAAKNELAGVKSAQATFEQSTTRRLTELANVADGKASKSELVQTAEELKSRIASVHLGRRNLLKGTKELVRYKPASEYNGFKVIRTVAGATSYRDSYTERTVIPATGTEYIAIFYARASENDYPMRCHFYNPNTISSSENSSGYKSRSSDGLSIIRLSTDWQLCWVKWTQTAIDQAKTVIIGRHGPQVGGKEGVWVEICAPALFEGNLVGDWTPAYEDQEERVSAVESSFKQKADSLEAGVSSLREGLKTKADSSALTVLSDSIKQSVKSLETDTQNKLDSKLSTAEFDVRASGIRQEIVNATKDKADKTLVTAEAGKLREELATVQAYVAADGTRSEALRTFSREETARQLTAERKLIEAGYVAKATHTEDVRSISRRFEELTEGGVNLLRNSATLLVGGDWRTGKWQATSGGNGTTQVVPVTSSPSPLIKSMIRIVNNTVGNKDLSQSAMALVIGQKYTVSCYARVASDSSSPTLGLLIRSWANNNDTNRKLHKTISNRDWQRYSFTFTADVVANSIQFGQSGAGSVEICAPKIELGTVATSWNPSPEDATSYADTKLAEYKQSIDGQLASVQAAISTANGSLTSFNSWKQSAQETLNKVGRVETGLNETKTSLAEFKQTAQGLRTDLTAVQAYVNADSTRSEALRTYSREETARQLTAERKLIEAGYVGKATYAEDVKGISRRFEELKSSSETKLAQFKQGIDGQFATMSNQIGETLKKTDISITPGQITLGTGKVVNGQTLASLFVQNPESMQAITKLMRITGDLIVDGSITGRDLAAGAITTPHLAAGAVTAEVLGANAVTADKVKADDALLEKLSAGEALLRKLMAKDAFINRLQSIDFTAEQVKGGMIKALNGALKIDLNNGQYNVMTDQAAIRRVLNGYPNQFLKFTSETEGGAPASVTVLGANRDGTENSKNDSFAGIRLFSGNKVERTEIISDVVRFATGAVNYRGWEMRTLYGNDNRQVILQPFGNVTRSNIVANYFNGIDLVNVLETLNQMMANLGNHTGRHDIFGPIRGLGARKYVK